MNWEALHTALTFLDAESDKIIVQVPYHCDIMLVVDYIMVNLERGLGGVTALREKEIVTRKGRIVFEVTCTGEAGYVKGGPMFLVERANGDNGLGLVHAVE